MSSRIIKPMTKQNLKRQATEQYLQGEVFHATMKEEEARNTIKLSP